MFFKELLLKKMLKAKGVPAEQADSLLEIIKKNPALFQKMAGEIEARSVNGGDQTQIAMEVMQKYQSELKGIFNK